MLQLLEDRAEKIRASLGLGAETDLLPKGAEEFYPRKEISAHLARFNFEWHLIPEDDAVPLNEVYFKKFYPRLPGNTSHERDATIVHADALRKGHRHHQGRIIAVESTQKPRYLPGNRQYYGTLYGFDYRADPFTALIGRAGFVNGTRFAHNYLSLRTLIKVINDDWRSQGLMPEGYRVTVCPPAVFNFVGLIFHQEWSETESLELGFYRDDAGNATCFAVGCNGPGDFSYIRIVAGEAEWTMLGFRLALVPE
jgi:hypothetical protein